MLRLIRLIALLDIAVTAAVAPTFGRQAVSLRFHDSVTVRDTVIRLGDIADISAESAGLRERLMLTIVGESAPAGFLRRVQTADLLMFRLKPMFKDIEFNGNSNMKVKVATHGILRRAGDFDSVVTDYLIRQSGWKSGQVSVAIQNGSKTFYTYEGPLEIGVEGLRSPLPRGLKPLQLMVTQFGRVMRIPLECRISVSAPVVVAVKAIPHQKVIGANDLELRIQDLTDFPGAPYFSLSEAIGKRAVQDIASGGIVTDRVTEIVPVVQKGDQMSIEVVRGDARVSVMAVARENGSEGQMIWVENSMTHRLVRVTVKSAGYGVLL
jgi:flagella basal body P-ring formation protein FlgA